MSFDGAVFGSLRNTAWCSLSGPFRQTGKLTERLVENLGAKQAAYYAFQAMAVGTEFERRNKAMFALVMIIGVGAGTVASLRLTQINPLDG